MCLLWDRFPIPVSARLWSPRANHLKGERYNPLYLNREVGKPQIHPLPPIECRAGHRQQGPCQERRTGTGPSNLLIREECFSSPDSRDDETSKYLPIRTTAPREGAPMDPKTEEPRLARSHPRRHGPDDASIRVQPLKWFYRRAIVTPPWLRTPPTVSTRGSASPERAFSGTRAFTWKTPATACGAAAP